MRGVLWLLPPLMLAAVFLVPACLYDPCDDYVDYICTCHDGDPDFDCDEFRTIYDEAPPDVQDQCLTELNIQMDEDEAANLECDW